MNSTGNLEGDDDALTTELVVVISVASTLLLSLPLGVLIGCCGVGCSRQCCGAVCTKCCCNEPEEVKENWYASIDTVKSGIATNMNKAYGRVRQT